MVHAASTLLPSPAIAAYVAIASFAMILCLISLFAIIKTKRTVYSTRLFSSGLLIYDILFLIFSGISKFFVYEDGYFLQHLARGFHVSSWIIVGSMSFERLCAINWPYSYLKIASKCRTRAICMAVIVISFLQYWIIRGCACYATNEHITCGIGLKVYLLVIFVVMPVFSFISYGKVYRIINKNSEQIRKRHRMSDFRGTLVSFLYLINTALSSMVYLISGIYALVRLSGDKDGRLAAVTDFINLVNCLADPLIYVIWFREARLEILKLGMMCFPNIEPKISKMHIEIYNIPIYSPKAHRLCASELLNFKNPV